MTTVTALHDLTATEAARLIREREISPVHLVDAVLDRIHRADPTLRAFVTVEADGARAAARAAEGAVLRGAFLHSLHGVPFAAKDVYDAAGLPTTAGYPPLANNVAGADSTAVARMKAAGAILVGKTVTTQFASGDTPPTRNPWRLDRTPGGSSSGSAAAVGARLLPIALGTQTGGSIIRPAAYCGAVGLKPTYGRISRQGIFPLAWSLDHAGPIVRSVADAALVLGVLAGHDRLDSRSLSAEVPHYVETVSHPLTEPRVGLLTDFLERADEETRAHLGDVVGRLRDSGVTVEEARLPSSLDLILAAQTLTLRAEAAAVHAGWVARDRASYAPRIRAHAMVGQLIPTWAYLQAQRLRRRFAAEVEALLTDLDALLLPSAAFVAPEPEASEGVSFPAPWSLLGMPAITLPSGLNADGLPFGVQLVGYRLDEPTLLQVAAHVERVIAFEARPPESWSP